MTPDASRDREPELISLDAPYGRSRDQDGVGSLRDTQEESGDESELEDLFDLDEREAKQAGVHLDGSAEDEPRVG